MCVFSHDDHEWLLVADTVLDHYVEAEDDSETDEDDPEDDLAHEKMIHDEKSDVNKSHICLRQSMRTLVRFWIGFQQISFFAL